MHWSEFHHGSNDGQKGWIDHAHFDWDGSYRVCAQSDCGHFLYPGLRRNIETSGTDIGQVTHGQPAPTDPRHEVGQYFLRSRQLPCQRPFRLYGPLSAEVREGISAFGSVAQVPDEQTGNLRNDMHLITEALRRMEKQHDPPLSAPDLKILKEYRSTFRYSDKIYPHMG